MNELRGECQLKVLIQSINIYFYFTFSYIFLIFYSHQTLVTEYNIPEDILSTCLCLKNRGYLLSHVKSAQIEYSKAANKHSWIIMNLLKLIHQRLDIILIRLDRNHSIY